MGLSIKIFDAEHKVKAKAFGTDDVSLDYAEPYQPGDWIRIEPDFEEGWIWIGMEYMPFSLVYVKNSFCFPIPFGDDLLAYPPKTFSGETHRVYARSAEDSDIFALRSISENMYDHSSIHNCFPHASANIETRNEAVFAARCAIDGIRENEGHGKWPYTSWGIGQREDAKITIHFGMPMEIHSIEICLRADFPHDNYWTDADLVFDTDRIRHIKLQKTAEQQCFPLEEPVIASSVTMKNLIKSDDPSPFPALTQIDVIGRIAVNKE